MAQYINIDTEDNLDQVVKVLIEGTVYVFRLRYNDYSGWQLGIYDAEKYNFKEEDNTEAKLYGERKLMPFQNFLKFTHGVTSLPTGYLFLYDTESVEGKGYKLPDRYDLGQNKRFVLIYYSKEEVKSYIAEGV